MTRIFGKEVSVSAKEAFKSWVDKVLAYAAKKPAFGAITSSLDHSSTADSHGQLKVRTPFIPI